jgi:hypothetical protein
MSFFISGKGPQFARAGLERSKAAHGASQAVLLTAEQKHVQGTASVRRCSPFRLQRKLQENSVTRLRKASLPGSGAGTPTPLSNNSNQESAASAQPERTQARRVPSLAPRLSRRKPGPELSGANLGHALGAGRFLRFAAALDQANRTVAPMLVQAPKQAILLVHDNPKAQVTLLNSRQALEIPTGALVERSGKLVRVLELITLTVSGVSIDFRDGQRPVRFDAPIKIDVCPGTALIELGGVIELGGKIELGG